MKEHHTAFLMQHRRRAAQSGKPHDGRAPDYDDWDPERRPALLEPSAGACALSCPPWASGSDPEALDRQLTIAGCDDRRELPFHKMLLNGELPLTIGGGIGQSRLCMLLLGKAHIGEVQASLWDSQTIEACKAAGVKLL